MKLFFLLISFIGINCIPNCIKNKTTKTVAVKKMSASYQVLPTAAVFQFN